MKAAEAAAQRQVEKAAAEAMAAAAERKAAVAHLTNLAVEVLPMLHGAWAMKNVKKLKPASDMFKSELLAAYEVHEQGLPEQLQSLHTLDESCRPEAVVAAEARRAKAAAAAAKAAMEKAAIVEREQAAMENAAKVAAEKAAKEAAMTEAIAEERALRAERRSKAEANAKANTERRAKAAAQALKEADEARKRQRKAVRSQQRCVLRETALRLRGSTKYTAQYISLLATEIRAGSEW